MIVAYRSGDVSVKIGDLSRHLLDQGNAYCHNCFALLPREAKSPGESQNQKRQKSGDAELPQVVGLIDHRAGALASVSGLGSLDK